MTAANLGQHSVANPAARNPAHLKAAFPGVEVWAMPGTETSESRYPLATEFLALVMRTRCDAAAGDALHRWLETAGGVDWNRLRTSVEAARLAPLAHFVVRNEPLVPEPTRIAFKHSYHSNLLRNMLLLSELGGVLRGLAAANIPVVVLKGAALAETVYPNLALRTLGDVDLLVHQHDWGRVESVLTADDFRPLRAETHAGTLAAFENEMAFRKASRVPLDIDLHWSLFDSPHYQSAIPMEWFWQTAQPARIAGESVSVLGIEAEILHLCGHLWLHHTGSELFWLHDVAEVVTSGATRIDWRCLLERTQQFDLVLPVRKTLIRISEEWGAPVPRDVLAELGAVQPSAQERRVNAWLTSENRPPSQRLWADLISLPTWPLRLRFLWTNLIPSAAYMRERYGIRNPLLLPFYYPYRWYRGIRGLP